MEKIEEQIERLAEMAKREFDTTRRELRDEIRGEVASLRTEMETRFDLLDRRLDQHFGRELDDHAHRLKKLEEAVFDK